MALAKAITSIMATKASEPSPSNPQRNLIRKSSPAWGSIRKNISGPVELLSTTNMLSYNAPDIYPQSTVTSNSSYSGDSDILRADQISPITSLDNSSVESSPTCPQPNHLSCYFGSSIPQAEPPKLPKRAPSHTKLIRNLPPRASQQSARSYLKSAGSLRSDRKVARSSLVIFSSEIESLAHEFPSHDSESLSENEFPPDLGYNSRLPMDTRDRGDYPLSTMENDDRVYYPLPTMDTIDKGMNHVLSLDTDDWGNGPAIMDYEEQELISRGYHKFTAHDYMYDLHQMGQNFI